MKVILVVEDDDTVSQAIAKLAELETSYFPIYVHTCDEAVEVVSDIIPDLFLLDYLLPHMNGIQLYDFLHVRKKLSSIPAIIISNEEMRAMLEVEVQQRHLTTIVKPFDVKILFECIKRHCFV